MEVLSEKEEQFAALLQSLKDQMINMTQKPILFQKIEDIKTADPNLRTYLLDELTELLDLEITK